MPEKTIECVMTVKDLTDHTGDYIGGACIVLIVAIICASLIAAMKIMGS